MDMTIITTLAAAVATATTVVALVSRSIGNLRNHIDHKIDAQGAELGARIDAVRTELGGRIDRVETKLAETRDDVAFIRGRLTAQPDD